MTDWRIRLHPLDKEEIATVKEISCAYDAEDNSMQTDTSAINPTYLKTMYNHFMQELRGLLLTRSVNSGDSFHNRNAPPNEINFVRQT